MLSLSASLTSATTAEAAPFSSFVSKIMGDLAGTRLTTVPLEAPAGSLSGLGWPFSGATEGKLERGAWFEAAAQSYEVVVGACPPYGVPNVHIVVSNDNPCSQGTTLEYIGQASYGGTEYASTVAAVAKLRLRPVGGPSVSVRLADGTTGEEFHQGIGVVDWTTGRWRFQVDYSRCTPISSGGQSPLATADDMIALARSVPLPAAPGSVVFYDACGDPTSVHSSVTWERGRDVYSTFAFGLYKVPMLLASKMQPYQAPGPVPSRVKSTSTPSTVPVPTLGNPGTCIELPGCGQVKPSEVGFIPELEHVTSVVWRTWGGPQAVGTGNAYYMPPNAATGRFAKATVVAFDPGPCGGRYAYRSVKWYFPQYSESFTESAPNLTPSLLCPVERTTTPPGRLAFRVGPSSVWSHAVQIVAGQCLGDTTSEQRHCVEQFMAAHGASPEAIAYFAATGLFLIGFVNTGRVDVGYTVTPQPMDCGCFGYMLLNGQPQYLVPPGPTLASATYAKLRAAYRLPSGSTGLELDPDSAPFVESAGPVQGGREDIVLQFPLNNLCNACTTPYRARVAELLSSAGRLLASSSLGPCHVLLGPGNLGGKMKVQEPACLRTIAHAPELH